MNSPLSIIAMNSSQQQQSPSEFDDELNVQTNKRAMVFESSLIFPPFPLVFSLARSLALILVSIQGTTKPSGQRRDSEPPNTFGKLI